MKSYLNIREDIQDGDVLLCKTRKWFSVIIRMFTAESFNHVAVLVWMEGGLWVAEMREGKGFQMMPASQSAYRGNIDSFAPRLLN